MSGPNAENNDDSLANSDSGENSIDSGARDSDTSNEVDDSGDLLLRRYRLLDKIGSGGVGTVYCARDTKLDRKVAIKVLHPDCLSNSQIARLHREAKIIGQISHPSVVDVYDFDMTDKNEPVMVMEFLSGESLHEVLKRTGCLPITESLRIFIQICDAMEHAHKRGLIHRDIKTGNIMLVNDRAKILDFGMAKDATKQDATITKVGSFVGTPSSISPEQASGEKVDHRTDIYSMGCLMYETLTGRSPFGGNNSVETILKQINEPAPPLRRSDTSFPSDLQDIVARALKKKPGERFTSMNEMKEALEQTLAKYTGESELAEGTDDGTTHEDETSSGASGKQIQELTFGNLEATYGEPKSEQSAKSKSSLIVPLVVTSVLAVVLIFIGYYMIDLNSDKAPPAPSPPPKEKQGSTETNEFFVKSRKNNRFWYTLSDPITPEKIKALNSRHSKKESVTHLSLANTAVTNSQLDALMQLPLDVIDLRKTKANDETLKVLLKCPTLRSIILDFCSSITPDGLTQLRKLPDLRVLALADTGINDKHVEAASTIRNLRFLRLSRNPRITEAAAPHIASIPMLKSVAIGETSIRKHGIETILSIPTLEYIGLKNHGLTDNDIVTIPDNIGLIDLNGNKIGIKTIQKLRKIKRLWFADLRNCPGVTEHDSKALAMHVKRGEIWSDYNARDRDSTDCEWYFEPTVYDRSWQDSLLRLEIANWQVNYANPNQLDNFLSP